MSLFEYILAISGSCGGILVVVFTLFGDIIKLKINRKYSKEDREMAKDENRKSIEQKLDDFIQFQRNENAEIRQRLGGVESSIAKLARSTSSLEYNDIRRDALIYIRSGSVEPESRLVIKKRWRDYKDNYNDCSLDDIMKELDNLRTSLTDN